MTRALLPILFALAHAACLHAPYEPERLDARALRDSVTTDAGEARFHAIPFPPRARTRPTRLPLVVVEPLVYDRALLLENGGLIASLEGAGFPVWLVGPDAPDPPPDDGAFAQGVARSIGSVARAMATDRVDVLSLARAGPASLDALFLLDAAGSPVRVSKLAFLGAPLDTGHPAALERYPQLPVAQGTSVLFVAGKVDGLGPTESSYPVFALWGSAVSDRTAVRKRFFIAGLENGFARDYDGRALLDRGLGGAAVWDHLVAFFSE